MSSWRGKKKPNSSAPSAKPTNPPPQPSSSATAEADKRSWRKRSGASSSTGSYWSTGGRKRSLVPNNIAKLFIALLVVFTSTALFSWYLMRTDQLVPYLSVAVVEFPKPFGPNGWAIEEQQLLSDDNIGFSKSLVRVRPENRDIKDSKSLSELFNGALAPKLGPLADKRLHLTPGGPGGRFVFRKYSAVIIHLSTHGIVNQKGEPCLIFGDCDPLDDSTWTPLRNVLTEISDLCSQYPKPVKALVLLDCARQFPDSRMGLFTMGFAQEAKREIAALNRDNLAVLLAADENQISWPAPELGGSVFGVNVLRGLQGEADASGNKRVTVNELSKYVIDQTQLYVAKSRAYNQTPVLCWPGGADRDFEIAYTGKKRFAAKAQPSFSQVRWSDTPRKMDPWRAAMELSSQQAAQDYAWAGPSYQSKTQVESNPAFLPARSFGAVGVSLHELTRLGVFDPAQKVMVQYKPAEGSVPAAAAEKPASSNGNPASAANAGAPSGTSTPSPSTTPNTSPTPANSATASGPASSGTLTPDASGKCELGAAIADWLEHDRAASKDKPLEPPKFLGENIRYHCIYQAIAWLSKDSKRINAENLGYIVDGLLASFNDPVGLTREEALLRNMNTYLETISGWNLGIDDQIKPETWKALFDTHEGFESALSVQDSRASFALEKMAVQLNNEYRLMLDYFFDADSPTAVTNANRKLQTVRQLAQDLTLVRDELENAWQVSDATARAMPLLWDWRNSLLNRQGTEGSNNPGELESLRTAWQALASKLASGAVPSKNEIADCNNALNKLSEQFRLERPVGANVRTSAVKTLAEQQLLTAIRPIDANQINLVTQTEEAFQKMYSELSRGPSAVADFIATAQLLKKKSVTEIGKAALAEHAELINAVVASEGEKIGLPDEADERSLAIKYGGVVRSKFKDIASKLPEFGALNEAFQSEEGAQITAAIKGYLQRDGQARLAANLLPAGSLALQSPSMFVQATAEQNDVLWHARRLIDDFWATPEIVPTVPYFELAAQSWLKQATAIEGQNLRGMRAGTQKLTERKLTTASQQALAWKNLLKGAPESPVAADSFRIKFDWNALSFPAGEARMNLLIGSDPHKAAKLQSNGSVSTTNTRLSVGTQRESVDREPQSVPEGNFSFHQIAVTYRGHVADYVFTPPRSEPPRVLGWNVDKVQPVSIQVKSVSKPRRIVFILDCSYSMKALKEEEPLKFFNQAKAELIRAISELTDPQVQIAVIVFGHSKEWETKSKDKVGDWFKKTNRQVSARRPYEDVETIFTFAEPAVNSERIVNAKLRRDIEELEPFGRTPLYLSIIEASKLLRADADYKGNQRIVVITDGADDVTPVSSSNQVLSDWVDPRFRLNIESVKSALPRNRFRLDVIRYRMDKEFPADFLKFAESEKERVIVHPFAEDGSALSNALRKSLESDQYDVFRINNKTGEQMRAPLNAAPVDFGQKVENIAKNQPDLLPGDFLVKVNDKGSEGDLPLALFGGELIEVEYDSEGASGQRFEFQSFREFRDVKVINSNGSYLAKPTPRDQTKKSGDTKAIGATIYNMAQRDRFRVAVESNDRHQQTRRPDQVLVEYARSAKDTALAWTCDTQWDPRFLVPVFAMPLDRNKLFAGAKNQDTRLAARVWFRKLPENLRAYSLSDLSNGVEVNDGLSVTATFETQYDKGTLIITERFSNPTMVAWNVTPAADVALEHRFYKNRVEHQYTYSSPDVRDTLRFTGSIVDEANKAWESTDWFNATE